LKGKSLAAEDEGNCHKDLKLSHFLFYGFAIISKQASDRKTNKAEMESD